MFDKLYELQIPSSSAPSDAALCHFVYGASSRTQPLPTRALLPALRRNTKASPDAVKAARLTRLKNQVDLTADQEAKAKPIIDKYVDDRQAANGDRAKLVALKTKFDSDIDAILTPDQQKKLAAAKSASVEKIKAARAAKAAAGAKSSPSPSKNN